MEKTIRIPRSLSVKAAQVLKGFLNKNPADRLGCHRESAFNDILNHPFFKSIDWDLVSSRDLVKIIKFIRNSNDYSNSIFQNGFYILKKFKILPQKFS